MAKRPKLPKTFKRVLASALVLLIVIVGLALAYTYFWGTSDSQNIISKASPGTSYAAPIKPAKPSPKAPESASITFVDSPVKLGAKTSVGVQTLAGSKCEIAVTYNNQSVKASGLVAKTADDFGTIRWDWTVSKSAPAGKRQVAITCSYHKKSAFVEDELVVK